MDLSDVMKQRSFVVVGNTHDPEKYAYKIKQAMLAHEYQVDAVGSEYKSINEVPGEIDIIDLCIRADRGLELLKECKKPFRGVVIQPGASSEALLRYLEDKQIPYLQGCLLKGLQLYKE